MRFADWECPEYIEQSFGAADLLGNGTNRVVFDIGGNNYRMICKYAFGSEQIHLFICWIGSHREYDSLCKKNEQYTINNY
ncbi:type II toxin-antitoxin system HigB family toxin [Desertivirga arenae]|uniref:type II toxin-antitoxin system HigB family toxin n=1 Tax=Desertivirga arenae TaxID=2810309 RepID=UPI00350F3564